MNLWLHDEPLRFQPALGEPVTFQLFYKQRDEWIQQDQGIFGFGGCWNSPWGSYIWVQHWDQEVNPKWPTLLVFYAPQGHTTWFAFAPGQTEVRDYYSNCSLRIIQEQSGGPVTGFEWLYPNGIRYVYGFRRTDTSGNWWYAFLSSIFDRQAFETRLIYDDPPQHPYDPFSKVVRLWKIKDADGSYSTLEYNANNSTYPNLVSRIVDRFAKSASLEYYAAGHLSAITDSGGLSSSIGYVPEGLPASLTTPYGATVFNQYGDLHGPILRAWTVTEPNGDRQNYACYSTNILIAASFPLPNAPQGTPGVPLDNTPRFRDSFYWNRRQSENLPADFALFTVADFRKGRMRHWLSLGDDFGTPEGTLSLERAPSPDGDAEGQVTWYDYAGKPNSATRGTQIMPAVVSRLLPGNSTWYEQYQRNVWGLPSSFTSTYGNGSSTRTYSYDYWDNLIDLKAVWGPNTEVLAYYTYNSRHQVLTETLYANEQTGYPTTYAYDADGRLSTRQSPAGLTSTYTYGGNKYLSQITDQPVSRTQSFTWQNGHVLTHTDARGVTRTFSWDNLGRLTKVQFPDATFIEHQYTALDRTGTRDRLGKWTYYIYDSLRRLASVTDPMGRITQFTYCGCGSPETVTDALGKTTHYTRNNAGWKTSVVYPDNTSKSYQYNPLGQLTTSSDYLGSRTYAYNHQGLLTTINGPAGIERNIGYDIMDNPISVTDANGVTVSQTFDFLGRIKTRAYPNTSPEQFYYSARGMTSYTGADGKTTQYGYDEARRKTSEITPKNEPLIFTYNAGGDLLTLTDARGKVTSWTYDNEGRMLTKKYAGQSFANLECHYNANGRVDWRRFWSGPSSYATTSYTYDDVGNLTLITYPSSPAITLVYDALNRLINMTDALGLTTTGFTYDDAGNLKTEVPPWSNSTITYGYHANVPHWRTSLSLQQPAGIWSEAYTPDAAKRLHGVSSPAGSFTYTYAGAGVLWTNLALPNSAAITNAYDAAGRLTGTWLRNSSGPVLNQHLYQYNSGAQRIRQTRSGSSYVTYNYDDNAQLLSALGSGGQSTENLVYSYDTGWNMMQRTDGGILTTYSINDQNQATGDGTYSYTFDANGNRTDRTQGGAHLNYTYDDENQLISVVSPNTFKTEFVYDGLNRLRIRKESTWNPGGGGTPTPLVTGITSFGTPRNDWTGWVGFQFTVGANPLTVSELGRWVVSGNGGTHTVQLFYSNGNPIPNASVSVNTYGKTAGEFAYATLSSPVTLAAGTTYAVMSQEVSGGDWWYDYAGTLIALSADANSAWAVWAYNNPPPYYGAVNGNDRSYGPVNLRYTTGGGGGGSTILVSGVNSLGSLRNNHTGWVGFQFTVGASPLTVSELGRWVVSGNGGTHTVQLFYSNGNPIPNASVSVNTSGKTAGQFAYATLSSPVTLAVGTTYAVMSQEVSGGDRWYDYAGTLITLSVDANSAWAVWAYNNPPPYYGAVNGNDRSYGPVNLRYTTGGGGSWTLASETRYLYDGRRVIQERNESNVPTVAYTRGLDLSGTQEGAGGIGGLLARSHGYSGGNWSTHSFYHADGGGNVTCMINSAQTMVAQYVYDPFGRMLSFSGSLADANIYRFSSKEIHLASGFYYYGFRFYDPATQRWVNRDPLGEMGEINLYRFVGNKPVHFADPFGLLDYYYSSGGFLQPAGPWAYLEADTTFGNLGAGIYNTIPFAYNFVFGPFLQIGTWEGTVSGQNGDSVEMVTALAFDSLAMASLFLPGEGSLVKCPAAEGTMAVSPYRMTTAGETFSHYGYAENAASFEGGLRPGGFATSVGDLSGAEAQSGLALPRPTAPPNAVYTVTPQPGTWIRANPVTAPQFGQPGGLPEFQFPGGTGPGTVSPPRLIP